MGRQIFDEYFMRKMRNKSFAYFSDRQSDYVLHVLNGLFLYGAENVDEIYFYTGRKNNISAAHIYEPFATLNSLGYGSPSVVSLCFYESQPNDVVFWGGNDNGLPIFDEEITSLRTKTLPRNNTATVDFWHFVDAVGDIDPQELDFINDQLYPVIY